MLFCSTLHIKKRAAQKIYARHYPDEICPGSLNRIYHIRRELGKSTAEFAELTGLCQPVIKRLEKNGEIVPIRTMKKLAKALPEYPIWFIGGYDFMPERTLNERLMKAKMYRCHVLAETEKAIGARIRNGKLTEIPGERRMKRIKKYVSIIDE